MEEKHAKLKQLAEEMLSILGEEKPEMEEPEEMEMEMEEGEEAPKKDLLKASIAAKLKKSINE